MALAPSSVLAETLAWLAHNADVPKLIGAWRSAAESLDRVCALPTADEFESAKRAVRQSSILTDIELSRANFKEARTKIGLLLLAQVLREELLKIPTEKQLRTPHFNPALALATILRRDAKLATMIMPAPQWLRNESLPAACSNASSALQQNLSPLVLTECEAHHADILRRLVAGSHAVAMSHDALDEALAKQPSDHWLTIVIPALRAPDALPALQSICEQSNASVTILVIAQGPSNPSLDLEKMALRLRNSSKSELVLISAFDDGPYDAMNLGIKLANTPWIYFMGVDDSLHSHEVLAKVHDAVEQVSDNTKMIYGNVEISGTGHGTYDKQIYAYAFDYKRLQTQNPCHQAIFYRVDALRKVGGYSLAYPVCADWHANLRLWQTSAPIFIDLTVAKFSRGGISSTVYDCKFFRELPLIWEQNKNTLAVPSG